MHARAQLAKTGHHEDREKYCERGAEAQVSAPFSDVPRSRASAPLSLCPVDDCQQRIRNMEALIDQERQEAQDYIHQVEDWNKQQLDEKQK